MHKNEVIRRVASETQLSHDTVARVLNRTLDLIGREVGAGRRVVLTGFGSFELRERRTRRGVDPRTGGEIVVGATRTPGFTASASLKNRIARVAEPAAPPDEPDR